MDSLFLKGQLISAGAGGMSRIMMIIAAFLLKERSAGVRSLMRWKMLLS